MAIQKKQGYWLGYFTHGLVIFLSLLLLLMGYHWVTVLGYATIISLTHLVIDLFKPLFSRKKGVDLIGFLLDQLFHLTVMVMIWQYFQLKLIPAPGVMACFASLVMPETVTAFTETFPKIDFSGRRSLVSAIMVVYVCWGGGFFVQKFLALLHESKEIGSSATKGKAEHIGFWIGVLERFIILILVTNNALTAVAFIFTAKSIARFSELNDKTFAEYYLTGTLLSTTLAVLGGFLLNGIISVIV